MKPLLLVLVVLVAPACAAVPRWERETLASTRMRLDADAGESNMIATRVKTREEGHVGSPGSSSGGAAGGCGCN